MTDRAAQRDSNQPLAAEAPDAQSGTPKLRSDGGQVSDRSPLGREIELTTALRIWSAILVIAILSVGILQQRVESYHAFNRDRYAVALVLSSLVAGLVWALMRWVLRVGPLQSVSTTAVFMLLFFRWHLLLELSSRLRLSGIVADLFVVAVAAVVAAVLLSRSRHLLVVGAALFLAVGGFLFGVSPYVQRIFVEPAPIESSMIEAGAVVGDDVVVILLDAYLREDQLLELMQFDNSGFRHELESRGFLVDSDATSNYNLTYGSVPSMMALDLPIDAGDISLREHELVRFLLGGGGPFFGSFREAGYEVTSHVTGWKGTRCSPAIDHCIRQGIVSSTAFYMAEITPIAPVVQSLFVHPLTLRGMEQLQSIGASANEAFVRDVPQLAWEHIGLPHPPLHYDADCVLHDDAWRRGTLLSNGSSQHQPRVVAYTEQIECVNEIVLGQVDEIVSDNPDATILIISDHGPRSQGSDPAEGVWTERQLGEYFSVITAIRTSHDCDSVIDAATMVNTFRRFVGCVLDVEVDDVADRQFILPHLGSPRTAFEITPPGQ